MTNGFTYRCEATSVEGFVQQLAVSYVRNGYWFYVTGYIREGRDPHEVDRKLIDRYGIDVSKFTRARRKKAGHANIHYLRHNQFFVLIATPGTHRFFAEEANVVRDIRREPVAYEGYALSYRKGQATVRIERGTELNLKAYFEDVATRFSAASISRQFRRLPFQPYAPVRRQLLGMLGEVNRLRRVAGLERVPVTSVRWKRWIVKPFGESGAGEGPRISAQAPAGDGDGRLDGVEEGGDARGARRPHEGEASDQNAGERPFDPLPHPHEAGASPDEAINKRYQIR
jgi:hypothetical protein